MKLVAFTVALLLVVAVPARAGELGRVEHGHSISDLVADPAGGVWTLSSRQWDSTTVTRLDVDRPPRRVSLPGAPLYVAALGPDGSLWINSYGDPIRRVDREARLSIAAEFPFGPNGLEAGMATGPDGRLWTAASSVSQLARISHNGVVTLSPFPVAGCERPEIADVARAADDAMWLADLQCNRLIRVPREGAPSVISTGELRPAQLEADPAGGMWFAAADTSVIGHSGGARHRLEGPVADFAVTPDGTVWVADGSCTLARIGGPPVPAPTRVLRIDSGPAGLIVAGASRVFVGLEGPPCDETPPEVTIRPRRPTLEDLRRGKLRVTVREPADITLVVDDPEFGFGKLMRRPGTWTFKPSRALLRHLKGRRSVYFYLSVTDADGNDGGTDGELRLRR